MSYANFVQARLAGELLAGSTSVELQAAVAPYNLPPEDGGTLVLADSLGKPSFVEVVTYTSRTGTTLNGLVRGQESTTARDWPVGSYCYQSLTAGEFGAVTQAVDTHLADLDPHPQYTTAAEAAAAAPVQSINSKAGVVTLSAADVGAQPASANLTSFASKTAPSGEVVGTTDAQTLTNKTLTSPTIFGGVHTGAIDQTGSVRANVVALISNTLNCSLGNYFTRTISANSAFEFIQVPASRAYSCTLELTHTGGTITWPTSVQWPGGTAPTLTTGKTHIFIFVTDDGGARWRGAALTNYTK